jgi:dihydrofolate reductase
LIDELRLIVHPIVLGTGQALFGGVSRPRALDLVEVKSTSPGRVIATYRVQPRR